MASISTLALLLGIYVVGILLVVAVCKIYGDKVGGPVKTEHETNESKDFQKP